MKSGQGLDLEPAVHHHSLRFSSGPSKGKALGQTVYQLCTRCYQSAESPCSTHREITNWQRVALFVLTALDFECHWISVLLVLAALLPSQSNQTLGTFLAT